MEIPAEVYNDFNQPHTKVAIEAVSSINEKRFTNSQSLLKFWNNVRIFSPSKLNMRFDIIVDIGCGSGNITLNVLGKSFDHKQIFAFDIDENMVKLASRENASETISYEVGNIGDPWENLNENLKKLEGSVDLVWSNRVLHWVSDKEAMGKNIVRLMKPGGKFVAIISICRDLRPFMTPELSAPEGREIWRDWLTQDEQFNLYKKIFTDAGLENLSVEFQVRYGEYSSGKFLNEFYLPALFTLYKKQRMVLEEFEKLSEDTKKTLENFIHRNGLSQLNEPPSDTIDMNQKGYYNGQYFINGTKRNSHVQNS